MAAPREQAKGEAVMMTVTTTLHLFVLVLNWAGKFKTPIKQNLHVHTLFQLAIASDFIAGESYIKANGTLIAHITHSRSLHIINRPYITSLNVKNCHCKTAIINTFQLTIDQIATCMWKESLVVTNPRRIITPICCSSQCCSVFQLIVLVSCSATLRFTLIFTYLLSATWKS